ncbi:MAG TPA: amylo-alpha-1,6-glucosidase, partial [Magnetospirillaceae bacterium]
AIEPPQFYIPATASTLERRPRTLKHGNTFAVLDHYGDIGAVEHSPEGLFHEDTRHLSRFELMFEGHRLMLLSSTMRDDNASLTVDLANPDLYRDGHIVFPREKLHIIRTKFLWQAGCYERLGIRNFDDVRHRVRLSVNFAADFADLFEVRGEKRTRRGTARIELADDTVTIRYRGLDQRERITRLSFSPKPRWLENNKASFEFDLEPGAREQVFVTVHCDATRPVRRGEFFVGMREARHAQRDGSKNFALVETSNDILNLILCRSISDLYMLITDTPQGPYPYAGIPWFSTAFGRDGIITALQLLWLDPRVAKGVLKYLAATQAKTEDPAAAAQPGKILHETRQGEMARLGEVPFRQYYGTVDATPLFVLLAGRYFERTNDRDTMWELWPHIEAALLWIDTYGDPDDDGFVEYFAEDGKGLRNQGWKDSADSVMHEDGKLVEGSVALCEVQAYVYAAKRHAAKIARALGKTTLAEQLDHQADRLRFNFEDAFWCEDLGIYALALDGDKRPCRVRSSNAGHALFAGIASPERAARLAETLLSRDLYSGWGIRTLGASEKRYNPMSYHNGSVWPHDNALIALGFARYGLKAEALKLFTGMFGAIQYMDLSRPPELFCGFNRRYAKAPTLYPVACSPQAWAAGAPLAFLEACLGLHCDAMRDEVRFDHPVLPDFVGQVRIQRLRVDNSQVDLLAQRHAGDVAVNVLNRQGSARVITET